MKVFTHNFNPMSNSGPNKFSRQLFNTMIKNHDIDIVNNQVSSIIRLEKSGKTTLIRA